MADHYEPFIPRLCLKSFAVIDFSSDMQRRIFARDVEPSCMRGELETSYRALGNFVRATPASSSGLVFLCDLSDFSDLSDLSDLGRWTTYDQLPKRAILASQLETWLHTRAKLNDTMDEVVLSKGHLWSDALLKVSQFQYSNIYNVRSQITTVELPISSIGVFDISGECEFSNGAFPTC
jgi:hypothetical protein